MPQAEQNYIRNFAAKPCHGKILPETGMQKDAEETDDYEDDFEPVTEEAKDLNTSQTGKGSSQEEKSSSSNFDINQQTSGSQSDEKLKSSAKDTSNLCIDKLLKVSNLSGSPVMDDKASTTPKQSTPQQAA